MQMAAAIHAFQETVKGLKPGQRIVVSVEDENGRKVRTPREDIGMSHQMGESGELWTNPAYGPQDCDTLMFLKHFKEPKGSLVLEVGANEESSADILIDNGYKVLGVDLRARHPDTKHPHLQGDFAQVSRFLKPSFDAVYSTSAIEHFGLPVYGFPVKVENYDSVTVDWMYQLLRPGGNCYITVPYGREFIEEGDWRVYCKHSLQSRLIRNFEVWEKVFFLSGGCNCPDKDGIVTEEDADNYSGKPPHVTVLLCMKKPVVREVVGWNL